MNIDFYFDFTSPYSYLAWERILSSNAIDINKVNFIPVLVGKIISELGGVGPAQIISKRNYLFKDCLRRSTLSNIQFKSPSKIPFNPLDILRMAIALEAHRKLQGEFITQTFRYGWRDGNDYEDFEKFKLYIVDNTSLTEDQYILYNSQNSARKILKSNISKALNESVFGVPSFVYKNEVFWGEDSIAYLEKMIQNSDVLEVKMNEYKRFIKIIEGE